MTDTLCPKDQGGSRTRPYLRCALMGFGTVGRMDPDESEKEAAGTGGRYLPLHPPYGVCAPMGFGTSMMSRPRHKFEVGFDRDGDGWSQQHLGCVCPLMGFGTVGPTAIRPGAEAP